MSENNIVKENKYIEIREVPPPRGGDETHLIFNKSESDILGWIEYYKPWRQHVFVSTDMIVWNNDCLQLVNDFLTELKKK